MTAIPTAAPDELTYRVAWEIIATTQQQVTVRIRREPDPGDSDGIPMAVDAEVSVRGSIASDAHTGQLAETLSREGKLLVLRWLAELACRHGHADVIDTPIQTESGVSIMIWKLRACARWLTSLEMHRFEELSVYMREHGASVSLRASGIAFVRERIAKVVPNLAGFEDQAHYCLEL